MTNHKHVILTLKDKNLSDIITDFKTFTSKSFLKLIQDTPESRREWLFHMFKFYARQTSANKEFKIWTNNNHPIELTSEEFFNQKIHYIRDNPVRAGIVHQQKDCIYSSASNYANLKRTFETDFLL